MFLLCRLLYNPDLENRIENIFFLNLFIKNHENSTKKMLKIARKAPFKIRKDIGKDIGNDAGEVRNKLETIGLLT